MYVPSLDEIRKMHPRPMVSVEQSPVSQPHEEWTETVRLEAIGNDLPGSAGAKIYALPANPGTELIEVILTFDKL